MQTILKKAIQVNATLAMTVTIEFYELKGQCAVYPIIQKAYLEQKDSMLGGSRHALNLADTATQERIAMLLRHNTHYQHPFYNEQSARAKDDRDIQNWVNAMAN